MRRRSSNKEPRRFWTKLEFGELGRRYANESTAAIAKSLKRSVAAVYNAARKQGLEKSPEFLARYCCLQKGAKIGVEYRFSKGHEPANKGTRRPGWAPGRMAETQFKKGQNPHTWHPVGSIVTDNDGYLRIKVRERRPTDKGGWDPKVWPPLHRHVWKRERGRIPKGKIIVFKDRDRTNCTIENLEIITRAELAHRNRMWGRLPRELAEAIQLNGALKRRIRRLSGKEQNQRSA